MQERFGQAIGVLIFAAGIAAALAQEPSPSPSPSASPSAAATQAATNDVKTKLGGLGLYLTDSEGRSLYLFKADSRNQSNCAGACAEVWPPFLIPNGQTPNATETVRQALLGTIQRSDGSTQVTYQGQPLYYYALDKTPGLTAGEGANQFGGFWYLVKPDGSALEPAGS